jgi:hypothetical protein
MKTTQKQPVRKGILSGLPKFSIPPELLIWREVELLETPKSLVPVSRLHYIVVEYRHRAPASSLSLA